MLRQGEDLSLLYSDIHWFNEKISTQIKEEVFGNYIPVPPFSLPFYLPFTFLEFKLARIFFSLLCLGIFCFSLFRLLKTISFRPLYIWSAGLFIFPLYQNFELGQTYLLVTALLIETFLASHKDNKPLAGLWIAVLFHIKIFPAFILLYFIIKKEWRLILYSAGFIIILAFITGIFTGAPVVAQYFLEILPRLFRNEVINPFYYGHQGINIFYKNIFVYDDIFNPSPMINQPAFLHILQGITDGLLIYTAWLFIKRENSFLSFAFLIATSILLGKYTSSYSLIMLLPLALSLGELKFGKPLLCVLILAVNIPVSYLQNSPFIIQYSRILLIVFVFILLIIQLKLTFKPVHLLVICLFTVAINFLIFPQKQNHYFAKQLQGIQYDYEVLKNKLVIKSCKGTYHCHDTLPLGFTNNKTYPVDHNLYPRFFEEEQLIKYPIVVNDSVLLYLSDLNQGVGITVLRSKVISQHR